MSYIVVIFAPIYQKAMRTGRPARKETPYKVIVHTNGGRRYPSTKVAVIGEDSRKQYRHRHWSTVDDSNRFHPNTTYFKAASAERARLIFPEGWVLDKATGRGEDRRGRVEYSGDDVDRQFGPTWFLDKVAEETGVKAPTDISMMPKAVTVLTQSITERNRMDLFPMRAARVGRDELCAVDSTSISSYGFNIADIS